MTNDTTSTTPSKRKIKFRCFNMGTRKMIDLYKTTPLAVDPALNCDGLFIPFREGYEIMQFTGLHDRNEVEIYDDDIVERHVYLENGQRHFDYICQVKWNGWCYGLCDADGNQKWGLSPSTARECTVIGNICSNPELLNHSL
jgi:hypothetical protein